MQKRWPGRSQPSPGICRRLALAEPDKAEAALLQKTADEAERGVLCTVDGKQPAPEVASAKPLHSNWFSSVTQLANLHSWSPVKNSEAIDASL